MKSKERRILIQIGGRLSQMGYLLHPREILALDVENAKQVIQRYQEEGMDAACELAIERMGLFPLHPEKPTIPPSEETPVRDDESIEASDAPPAETPFETPNDQPNRISEGFSLNEEKNRGRVWVALGMCAMCLRKAPVLHLHHVIIRRSEGGPDEDWNLMPICVECHTNVHSHPMVDAIAVWLKLREGLDPDSLPFIPERLVVAQQLPENLCRALMGEDVRIPIEEQENWPSYVRRLIGIRVHRMRIYASA